MKTNNRITKLITNLRLCGALAVGSLFMANAEAAGTLTPVGASYQPVDIESHHVKVVINNGFAQTIVEQVFHNPNTIELEAIYSVPVPEKASLSEMTVWLGEKEMQGEVVPKSEANRVYEEEKAQGNSAGVASQESYQRYEFKVYPVPADGMARMRYVYYEPVSIDTGVGRYHYPLEEGETDEAAVSFWTRNDTVKSDMSVEVILKTNWPISGIRVPGFQGTTEQVDEHTHRFYWGSANGGALDSDFVFYYSLADDLPGRLEVIPYRADADKPGTFMMLLTPGADLKPLEWGADYVFVLDKSGSMNGKLNTLVQGVKKTIGMMRPEDRFRLVAFNDRAYELTNGWVPATTEGVNAAIGMLDSVRSDGGTNVYEGIHLGLQSLDADRVSSMILVTDGVTNRGIVDPRQFYSLLHKKDVRVFGFLMGNSSNWPLMRAVCKASGGAYRSVSNSDDIIGEVLLAKSKILHESLHDAALSIEGVKTFDVSELKVGKIYRGQQLAFFGRYEGAGQADVRLKARLSGVEKVYSASIVFPDIDTSDPEIERLWAMDRVQQIQMDELLGRTQADEAKSAIESLGVQYQIVTDHTSMLVLDDETFQKRGIQRMNLERSNAERHAQAQRMATPAKKRQADENKPMFSGKAPRIGGGGAIDPFSVILALVAGIGFRARKWRES